LGVAEFQAKFKFLANLFEQSELFAIMIWPGAKIPLMGPRPGRNGFAYFCRNKSGSSFGGETPSETSVERYLPEPAGMTKHKPKTLPPEFSLFGKIPRPYKGGELQNKKHA